MNRTQNDIEEKRAMRRFPLNVEIEWEGSKGRQKGTISELSSLGCFILCSGQVENGEIVSVFIPLADGMTVKFLGQVVNHEVEIGFGITFHKTNRQQQQILDSIIDSLNE